MTTQPTPEPPENELEVLRIRVILESHLRETVYCCTRVWEAWSVGTMGEDDFHPAWEDDELLDGLARELAEPSRLTAPAISQPEPAEPCLLCDDQNPHSHLPCPKCGALQPMCHCPISQPEWLPIGEAPRDGTWVEIIFDGFKVPRQARWLAGEWRSRRGSIWAFAPTHFRPISQPAKTPEVTSQTLIQPREHMPLCPICGQPTVDKSGRPNACAMGVCPALEPAATLPAAREESQCHDCGTTGNLSGETFDCPKCGASWTTIPSFEGTPTLAPASGGTGETVEDGIDPATVPHTEAAIIELFDKDGDSVQAVHPSSMAILERDLGTRLSSALARLGVVEKERDEEKRISEGYLQNANPSGCPACAEGICCGSHAAYVEHMGCVYAELTTLRAEISALRAERDADREMPSQLLDVHAICDQRDAAVMERDQLRTALAEAQADGARLDWLEANPDKLPERIAGQWCNLRPPPFETLRQAIDAAQQPEGQG